MINVLHHPPWSEGDEWIVNFFFLSSEQHLCHQIVIIMFGHNRPKANLCHFPTSDTAIMRRRKPPSNDPFPHQEQSPLSCDLIKTVRHLIRYSFPLCSMLSLAAQWDDQQLKDSKLICTPAIYVSIFLCLSVFPTLPANIGA